MKTNKLVLLILLSLVIRIILLFFRSMEDVVNHATWTADILKFGMSGAYDRDFGSRYSIVGIANINYPPVILYLFLLSNYIFVLFFVLCGWINQLVPWFPSSFMWFLEKLNYLNFMVKIPSILADIGLAVIIYRFIRKIIPNSKSLWPLISAALILFNPAFFYVSAAWGQVDSVILFFIMLSFYLLIYSKHYIYSAILITLAVLTKQTALIFVPIYIVAYFRQCNLKTIIQGAIASICTFWVLMIPFYQKGNIITFPFSYYLSKIMFISSSNDISSGAFNFWRIVVGDNKINHDQIFVANLTYYQIATLSVLIILSLIIFILFKRGVNKLDIFYAGFIIPLFTFLIYVRIHERHLMYALPFLLLLPIKRRNVIIPFMFISLANFLNLYHNWEIVPIKFLHNFVNSQMTIVIVIIGLITVFLAELRSYVVNPRQESKEIVDKIDEK